MEDDLQRPYSVYTRDDLKEKMNKQIDDISEIFSVSKPDATVLLMKLRWNSQLLSERLSEENNKLLTESGLTSLVIDSNQVLSDSSCDEFYEFYDNVDDDDDGDDSKISTPFCSHKFSTTYWSNYLEKNFFSVQKTLTSISCPHQDCGAAVTLDTIKNLTEKDKDSYDGYILRSYIEQNKGLMIKQCPAQGCSYFIEFHPEIDVEENDLNVVCLCGHTFCWRCNLESHRPVTCNNASDWLSRDLRKLSELSSVSWIESNTKPCPHCQSPVETGRGSRLFQFLFCAHCSGLFCWKCMQSAESHSTESGYYIDCGVEPVTKQSPLRNGAELEISCLDRWKACEVSIMEAKSELEAFKESKNMSKGYIRVIREGLMLVVQCRQFLKWSCVYEYIHREDEGFKKEYLRFMLDDANTRVQSYSETLKEEALSYSPKVISSNVDLSCVTSNIGNYFHHFIKTLQDGLDVVKVKHYDEFSSDRCTYANTRLDKVYESYVEKPSDSLSLN